MRPIARWYATWTQGREINNCMHSTKLSSQEMIKIRSWDFHRRVCINITILITFIQVYNMISLVHKQMLLNITNVYYHNSERTFMKRTFHLVLNGNPIDNMKPIIYKCEFVGHTLDKIHTRVYKTSHSKLSLAKNAHKPKHPQSIWTTSC